MKRSAQELSDMVSRRQFSQVVNLWRSGEAGEDDDSVYQVFLAASMTRHVKLAEELHQRLPVEMNYDAMRDVLLMHIRKRRVSPGTILLADQLVVWAPDLNRQAVAWMSMARAHRVRGSMVDARREINEAFRLMIVQEQPDPVWRRNVALWYLIIGESGMRTQALGFALEDPARNRRLIAKICYYLEIGRFIPIY